MTIIQPVSVFIQPGAPITKDEVAAIIAAINAVSMPAFGKHWPQGELTFGQPAGAWALWLLDGESTESGDLAFHVDPSGTPIMKVFPQTIARYGASLCQCIDHELKEALADPIASLTLRISGGIVVKEVCDPVSIDGIDLGNGMTGSNFVYPSWFVPGSSGPWDERGLCAGPLTVTPGGYKEELADGASQWQMMAMRGSDDMHNWRLRSGYQGRLAYRASNRSKLRVDARKWLMAKMAPKKYGDKLIVEQKDAGDTSAL
jgi:hypothetical protein